MAIIGVKCLNHIVMEMKHNYVEGQKVAVCKINYLDTHEQIAADLQQEKINTDIIIAVHSKFLQPAGDGDTGSSKS